MNPPNDNLSLTRHRKEANEIAYENDCAITFDPSITDPEDVTQTIRMFTSQRNDLSSKLPSLRPRYPRRAVEELTVYTDGSSLENGDENSRVGSGVWFGDNDPRNASIRVTRPGATNQTGELIAILVAAQRAPPDSLLHIKSDSKYAINGLTRHLPKWEEKGWIDVKNADIFQAIVTTLRQRAALTTFQWVKGHADVYGNECADKLAGEGARKSELDEIDLSTHPGFLLTGAKLATITQALAYRGIRMRIAQKQRCKTESNIKAVQQEVAKLMGRKYPLSTIWKSTHSPDIAKPTQDFLWKGLHGAHKVGTYWSYIPNCENRILCEICDKEDSMQHILCECKAPGQRLAWKLAETLWRRKSQPWKQVTLNMILGVGLMSFNEEKTPKKGGPDRLFRILITETAYLIWKLRCKRVIGCDGDTNPHHSAVEIAHRWMAALNTRLTLDRQMTRRRLSKRAIPSHVVKSTWTKVVEDEDALPENWSKAKEVLVGSVDQEVLLDLEIDESHTTG
ncbi:hypothetical protein QCA50_006528 [Cerrena zonata]|uniref:ribonuclease H n=1 Tax=Cerrena zonata TaxID=2478898 RepID=A0AAW0GJF2_9APHY